MTGRWKPHDVNECGERSTVWCDDEGYCSIATASLVGEEWHPVIVDRTNVSEWPFWVEYSLTRRGASFEPTIQAKAGRGSDT